MFLFPVDLCQLPALPRRGHGAGHHEGKAVLGELATFRGGRQAACQYWVADLFPFYLCLLISPVGAPG